MKSNPTDKILREVAEKYDQKEEVEAHAVLARGGLFEYEVRFFERHLKLPAKVLNVGCGAGREAIGLARQGFSVVAFDLSPEMVRKASVLVGEAGESVPLAVMNSTDIGICSGYFDFVVMIGQMLAFVPGRKNRVKALAECGRVLREGGILIVSTHSRKYKLKYRLYFALVNPWRRLLRALFGYSRMEENDRLTKVVSPARSRGKCFLHHYSMEEVLEDLRSAGLEPLECLSTRELVGGVVDPGRREQSYYLYFAARKGEATRG